MKIIVCVKVVPDTASRLKVADDGKQIVQTDLTWIISPYDEYAIEEGLKLLTEHWMVIFGPLIVLMVLLLRRGLWSLLPGVAHEETGGTH